MLGVWPSQAASVDCFGDLVWTRTGARLLRMKHYLGSVLSVAAKNQGRTPIIPLLANKKYPARKHIIFVEACGHKQGRTPEDICWRDSTPRSCTRCYQKSSADVRRGKGPKQVAASTHANEIVTLYAEHSIMQISKHLGVAHRIIRNILRGRGVEILSSTSIKERKYRGVVTASGGPLAGCPTRTVG